MLARVDIVSVNCPSTPATYHLISARRLVLLQPTSYIVNTARGDVIDEAALIKILREGKIAGAGLDVFEAEPNVPEALAKLPNLTLTPHMASGTVITRTAMADLAFDNLQAHFSGKPLLTPVPR